MNQKLKELGELHEQQKTEEELHNAKPEVIAEGLIGQLIFDVVVASEKASEEKWKQKKTQITLKGTVIDSVTFERDELELLEEKRRSLVQQVNRMSQMNHHLLVQYIGVSVGEKAEDQPKPLKKEENTDSQHNQKKGGTLAQSK